MPIDFEEEKPGIDFEPEAPERDKPGYVESGARGATKGLTFGFSDELSGALGAGAESVAGLFSDRFKDPRSFLERYREYRDAYRKGDEEAKKANPKTFIGSEIAGSLAGAGKAKILGKGLQGAARMGGLAALGNSEADVTQGDLKGAAEDTALGAATGAIMSKIPARTSLGVMGGAYLAKDDLANGDYGTAAAKIGGAGALAHFAPKAGGLVRKGFSNLMGVNDNAVKDYLARSKEINLSPSKRDVIEGIESTATGAQATRDAAKQALETAEKTKLESAGSQLQADIEDLKQKVIAGSKNARSKIQTMKNAPEGEAPDVGSIKTKQLKSVLTAAMNRLKVDKDLPATPGAATDSIGRLQAWRGWLDEMPENLTYEQAKKVLMKLDRETEALYARKPGEFAPEEQIGLGVMRRQIDQRLKSGVPEYADAMKQVSEDARLLGGLNRRRVSGNPVGAIQNLDAPQNASQRDLIDRLGKRMGRNYSEMASPTAERAALEAAEGVASPLQPVALRSSGQSSAENLVNRMTGGKEVDVQAKLNDQRLMDSLSKSNPELPQQMQNLKTANAFTGERTHGSRNAVRFGAAGGLIGSAIGQPWLGASAGAAAGAYVDKFGPKLAKGALDSYIPKRDASKRVLEIVGKNPAMQKFAQPLQQAAQRGDASFASTYYLMSQSYPELRQYLNSHEKAEDEQQQ